MRLLATLSLFFAMFTMGFSNFNSHCPGKNDFLENNPENGIDLVSHKFPEEPSYLRIKMFVSEKEEDDNNQTIYQIVDVALIISEANTELFSLGQKISSHCYESIECNPLKCRKIVDNFNIAPSLSYYEIETKINGLNFVTNLIFSNRNNYKMTTISFHQLLKLAEDSKIRYKYLVINMKSKNIKFTKKLEITKKEAFLEIKRLDFLDTIVPVLYFHYNDEIAYGRQKMNFSINPVSDLYIVPNELLLTIIQHLKVNNNGYEYMFNCSNMDDMKLAIFMRSLIISKKETTIFPDKSTIYQKNPVTGQCRLLMQQGLDDNLMIPMSALKNNYLIFKSKQDKTFEISKIAYLSSLN